MTLPVALSGSDVIGQAKTGTGKTLGFGLPLLERVTVPADVEAGRATPEQLTDTPQALVVVPTRELCQQVTNDLLTAGKVRNVRVLAIYGGRAYEPQVEALKKGVDVIVGTPGRLLDLAGQKKLNLSHVKALVLDEADEMLDLGFLPDVEKIINMLPAKRQTMLFSATMPGAVIGLARRYMSQPTHIRATSPDDEGATVRNIAQHVYRAHNMDKPEMVARILQADGRGLAMIFCRTKRTAADIADQLKRRGFASGAVHGDLGQGAREQALRAFRNGKVDVLVCTDVAARGIDVEGVTHVINYQSPEDEKTYLHRIGRTGRAGKTGTAITLVDWDDIPRWQLINKALELTFNDPVETYSSSPHLFEELSIPVGTKGVLPRSERTRAGLDAEEIEDLGETGGRGASPRGGRGGRPSQDRDRRDRDQGREQERERSARTPRRRRRTRNGEPVSAEAAATAAPVSPVAEDSSAPAEPRTPRRRRRTRSGAAAAVNPAAPTAAEAVVETAEAVVEAVAPVTGAEAPAKPRRRTRKKAEAAVETVETVVAAEPVAEPEAKPARARTRTRKKAEAVVDTVEATVETAEPKPARTRTRKKAEAAAESVAAEATTETTPRRTRKKAEPVEAAEAKPRRTRKKAEAAVDTAEAVEAKPATRTRKKAAAAPAEAEAATETKPRRTRKKAEAAVDTAEAVEAKPATRTRKKAAAAPVETEAAAETKPRRTRKKAEAAVDTVEAKPATRTRKKAAAAPVETEAAAEAKPRRTRKKAVAAVEAPEA
ncbi:MULTISPECIES: DEAD/DEAH box helicase [unclassified Streptomyces]|uniref:DEAD/DEAH box helicase n=1 Tax=Streptomyces sp. SID8367 TaxID=2690349 RepID=UPI000DB9FDDB|nr:MULTISPECIES: DEAD/DEAH box helicase [unclassified Streptomyces]MYT75955.1 DEAD/DEAH box helicase [Streptomyces sp. SID8367]RAJ77787.1 superfamily II DNA/RNA helicase [Streptomyces sp. PsTaAH-137]